MPRNELVCWRANVIFHSVVLVHTCRPMALWLIVSLPLFPRTVFWIWFCVKNHLGKIIFLYLIPCAIIFNIINVFHISWKLHRLIISSVATVSNTLNFSNISVRQSISYTIFQKTHHYISEKSKLVWHYERIPMLFLLDMGAIVSVLFGTNLGSNFFCILIKSLCIFVANSATWKWGDENCPNTHKSYTV